MLDAGVLDFLRQIAACCEPSRGEALNPRQFADAFPRSGAIEGAQREKQTKILRTVAKAAPQSAEPSPQASNEESRKSVSAADAECGDVLVFKFLASVRERELELAARLKELEDCRAQLAEARGHLQEVLSEKDELSRRAMLLRLAATPIRISRLDVARAAHPESVKGVLEEVRSSAGSTVSASSSGGSTPVAKRDLGSRAGAGAEAASPCPSSSSSRSCSASSESPLRSALLRRKLAKLAGARQPGSESPAGAVGGSGSGEMYTSSGSGSDSSDREEAPEQEEAEEAEKAAAEAGTDVQNPSPQPQIQSVPPVRPSPTPFFQSTCDHVICV
eukprot:tig00020562_g11171.t1